MEQQKLLPQVYCVQKLLEAAQELINDTSNIQLQENLKECINYFSSVTTTDSWDMSDIDMIAETEDIDTPCSDTEKFDLLSEIHHTLMQAGKDWNVVENVFSDFMKERGKHV